jgi:hypothetical protein
MQFSRVLGRLRELASWDGVLDEAAVPFGLEARLVDSFPIGRPQMGCQTQAHSVGTRGD